MGVGAPINFPRQLAGQQGAYLRVKVAEDTFEYVRDPSPVPLVEAASITPDLDAGNLFDLTLTASASTMQVPSFAGTAANYDGRRVMFRIRQDGTGGWTIAWAAGYRFTATYPAPVISTDPNVLDYYGFQYNDADGKWDLIAQSKGY